MARVERFTSTTPVPVEQAQLIDAGDFPADYSGAEALQVAGEAIMTYGEWRKRFHDEKIEMQDKIGIADMNSAMELAELEYQKEIIALPLEKHADALKKHIEGVGKLVVSQRYSPNARAFAQQGFNAWKETTTTRADIVNFKALERESIIKTSAAYEAALVGGFEEPYKLAEAEQDLDDQFSRSYEPAEAAEEKGKIVDRAYVEIENRAIDDVYAAIEAGNYKVAKELARNEFIPEKAQSTLRTAIKSSERAASLTDKILQDKKDAEIGGEFLSLLKNKLTPLEGDQLTFSKISTHPELSTDGKLLWFTKLMTFDNYSEAELQEAFIDKGEVLAEIFNMIDTGTLTNELDTMVGNGLSPSTAERIKGEIREPYKVQTDKLFKNIFGWTAISGFPLKGEGAFYYQQAYRDWTQAIKDQNATGDKIIEIGREIVRPLFQKYLKEQPGMREADIPRLLNMALGKESALAPAPETPTAAPAAAPTTPTGDAALPHPTNNAEYLAIPIGAEYIHPDGTKRIK